MGKTLRITCPTGKVRTADVYLDSEKLLDIAAVDIRVSSDHGVHCEVSQLVNVEDYIFGRPIRRYPDDVTTILLEVPVRFIQQARMY